MVFHTSRDAPSTESSSDGMSETNLAISLILEPKADGGGCGRTKEHSSIRSPSAVGGHVGEATVRRVASLLAVYGTVRRDLDARASLQSESLRSMRRWEAAGRPLGPGGVMPVFPRYELPAAAAPVTPSKAAALLEEA